MSNGGLDNFLNKVKGVTKQAAEQTGRAAKAAKLKMSAMSLTQEKTVHLQTIGQRCYTLFTENQHIDGALLQNKVAEELKQIGRIEDRIRELETEINELQANSQHVDVTDVTEPD
ncbi:MAG: hypothetical protein JSS86_00380 [Cyanobacteria bacterium SZAS LIN-2]|nr:hypothetical protein [Cyanobacteria bacterium SZAS LIN-3]MBS1994724.1 hypothetical protein [Cyanobacteria bacterium SZAS LIN-2]MBS2006930.1 hypothetical protein [Cyanobacteria bacterium SZAS TMP-1]